MLEIDVKNIHQVGEERIEIDKLVKMGGITVLESIIETFEEDTRKVYKKHELVEYFNKIIEKLKNEE